LPAAALADRPISHAIALVAVCWRLSPRRFSSVARRPASPALFVRGAPDRRDHVPRASAQGRWLNVVSLALTMITVAAWAGD